jgi:hypothetical protein
VQINPKSKSVSYRLEKLECIEDSLNEIERIALEGDGVSGQSARGIVNSLNAIRDDLCMKRGVQRHLKFAPGLKQK